MIELRCPLCFRRFLTQLNFAAVPCVYCPGSPLMDVVNELDVIDCGDFILKIVPCWNEMMTS